jgi:hypothetical protein
MVSTRRRGCSNNLGSDRGGLARRAKAREAEFCEAEQYHRPGRRLGHRASAATAADNVRVHRDSAGRGDGSAARDVCAGIERNAGLRHNCAGEIGGGPEGRGAADQKRSLPFPSCAPAVGSAQKILSTHAAAYNTFNVQRQLTSAKSHRVLRAAAMSTWREAIAAA